MPTSRRPTSGRGGDKDQLAQGDKYNKDSKAKATGNYMRTFSRTKKTQLVTTWDSIQYVTGSVCNFQIMQDVSGAVDSATVVSPALLNLLDKAWELYYTNANLKDRVDAEEASWKQYFAAYLCIAIEIQLQYNYRVLLPAFTESDTVPGTIANLSYFSQSSFDIFLASMAQYPAPKGVDSLVKSFASWIVQVAPEYERFTVRIPQGYYVPFEARYDLGDLEALREQLRVNLGGFTTHAKKFGLGTGSWSDPIKPVIKTLADPDVIAYFNHNWFIFYDNTPGDQLVHPDGGFTGNNLLTDYTDVEYFFKDTPNESVLHVLAPIFGAYDATNNEFGGWILFGVGAAEYRINMHSCSQHGTTVTQLYLTSPNANYIVSLFKAYDDGNNAVFKVNNNGTNFTATRDIAGQWKYALHHNLFMGDGRGATETNNDLLNYIGKLIT